MFRRIVAITKQTQSGNHRTRSLKHAAAIFCAVASVLVLALVVVSCSSAPSAPDAALNSLSAERLLANIRTLSSDQFEGRGPGSNGESLTIKYMEDQFRADGLEPGNPDGTFLQKVPLVSITPQPGMKITLTGHGQTLSPTWPKDFVAWTKRVVEKSSIDADMIFVGYGVQAPEFNWDDFKGVDVHGKVIVVLVNDPPVPDPNDPTKLDPKTFGGNAMTYYGRWTYKYEKAAEMGAAGCFIIHDTAGAGYPWEVVQNGRSGQQFTLNTPDKAMNRAAIEGWFSGDTAAKLFKMGGQDLAALRKAAVSRDFHPVPLNVHAKLDLTNTLRTLDSHNVVAKITGSDAKLKDEYVVYSAHWDHFGIGPAVNGDKIYHGAADNAAGSSALLEIARAYKQLKTPPKRTMVFLSVTAEEQGLLGSQYYSEHPLYPLARTAANINMDGMNVLGRTHDIVMIGKGASTLDQMVEDLARNQGRVVKPDPEPEKGFYYRSDHFNFAKHGVPAFDPDAGVDYVGKSPEWGMTMRDKYTSEDYHKPSDVIKPYWDLSGAVEDCQLFFLVGYQVANAAQPPQWNPGAEFKAIRDASVRDLQNKAN
jgi:Zn-dependent M28 family amino/carboxypeptidase